MTCGGSGTDGGEMALNGVPPLGLPLFDTLALAWFGLLWLGYALLLERSRWRVHSLSRAMDGWRRDWMLIMAERELRMIDTAIMAGLQNGTAFFASTSVIAIGGAFALLNSADEMLLMFAEISPNGPMTRREWEIKGLGLLLIFAYAFFKFGWSYRLFNYASILMGAVPPRAEVATPRGRAAIRRAGDMLEIAGRHFNRGLRAFFFAIGYLGWYAGPFVFVVATTVIAFVLARRQFLSDSYAAVRASRPTAEDGAEPAGTDPGRAGGAAGVDPFRNTGGPA
jgi:uncharacterized membrane protein